MSRRTGQPGDETRPLAARDFSLVGMVVARRLRHSFSVVDGDECPQRALRDVFSDEFPVHSPSARLPDHRVTDTGAWRRGLKGGSTACREAIFLFH